MMAPAPFTNKLIFESSPYLLQHAHNPVDWHPWNEETLEKARKLDRMLLISIGYSSCHWCHVMEKESFTDEEVAAVMNRHFICIKVDREERPDVDQVYMEAVQLITGGGGWPLNCFALPDGRPFFGGTYFRKEQWKQLLENVHLLFTTRRRDLEEQAGDLTRNVAGNDILPAAGQAQAMGPEALRQAAERLKKRLDFGEGGLAGAPKFPMPSILDFLLKESYFSGDPEIAHFLEVTLKKMAYGGLFDQAGGGFARYSTDARWKVPHFEKMLYDNAQLISVYSRAWQRRHDPEYADVVTRTVAFLQREMAHPSGLCYSSLDADSGEGEGEFYTWKTEEFRLAVLNHADLLARYYHLDGKGLWEGGRNILLRTQGAEEFALSAGLQPSRFRAILKTSHARLLKARGTRPRPATDDKVLTSWNALAIKGLLDAYHAFGKDEFLAAAMKNAEALVRETMQPDGRLFHTWKNGKASINGFLEDYSLLADALIELYGTLFDVKYLRTALSLAEYALGHFYDQHGGLFFVTSALDAPLIARKHDLHDNVVPSSNAMMAGVLHKLGLAFEKQEFLDISLKMQGVMHDLALQHPAAFPNWNSLMLGRAFPYYSVVICGPEAAKRSKEIRMAGYPNLFFCGGAREDNLPLTTGRFVNGKTMIYLCSGSECRLPTESTEAVKQFLLTLTSPR